MGLGNVSESVKKFYRHVIKGDWSDILQLPHSDVYYIRWAIYERTGDWYTVDHVIISMWLEGHIDPDEIKSIPKDYIERFFKGKPPDLELLRAEVIVKYNKNQEGIQNKKLVDVLGDT